MLEKHFWTMTLYVRKRGSKIKYSDILSAVMFYGH